MVVEESTLRNQPPYGYGITAKDVFWAVYALHPANSDGQPLTLNGQVIYGSAVAVSSDGIFLTASHVLDGFRDALDEYDHQLALTCRPLQGDSRETILVDEVLEEFPQDEQDIAVLRSVEAPRDHLKVRTRDPIEGLGNPVATFGYPLNEMGQTGWNFLQRTFSGVVSSVRAFGDEYITYEVDALFNPGLSGGPLLSIRRGDVIGIVHGTRWHTVVLNGEGIRYPAHISEAKATGIDWELPDSIGRELEERGVDYRHETEE